MPATIQKTQWAGTTTAFNTGGNWSSGTKLTGGNVTGTAQAGASGSITLAAGDAATTDQYVGYVIFTTGGTGSGQWRRITANNSGTKVATVHSNWAVNPDNTTTYVIGDIGIFAANAFSVTSNLSQSYASQIDINLSYSATGIGNATGASTYLSIATAYLNIGLPPLNPQGRNVGPQRLNFNLTNIGTVGPVVTIMGLQTQAADTAQTALRLLGTAMTILQAAGSASVAAAAGEVSTISTLTMTGGYMVLGSGVSIATSMSVGAGSNLTYYGSATLPLVTVSGTYVAGVGSGVHTEITVLPNGTVYYDGTGTITDLDLSGKIDLSRGSGTVVITNKVKIRAGGWIYDPLGRLSMSAGFEALGCTLDGSNGNAKVTFPVNRSYT